MNRLAILSAYKKDGIVPFAQELVSQGISILSTGGTAKVLSEAGIEVRSISDYTGHPEVLDGRVKSLHPKVHGGILARRDNPKDEQELAANEISPIDFVVVNLYPFTEKVREIEASGKANHESLVELIDIGGPTMIRAAAKNCQYVVPVCDPADYDLIASELREHGDVTRETRQALAAKVFKTMAAYDAAVARYFSLGEQLLEDDGAPKQCAPVEAVVLEREQSLRYGENPHQQAARYRAVEAGLPAKESLWQQLQGKELSFNNIVDLHAAIDVLAELYPSRKNDQAAVVIKHTNPCGAAIRGTTLEAFQAARAGDPVSAFGGIIALTGPVDAAVAEAVCEQFVEVVVVEELADDAAALFAKKKNLRLIRCDFAAWSNNATRGHAVLKNCNDDYVLQSSDNTLAEITPKSVVAGDNVSAALIDDLDFAWRICKHVKSNTIVVAKDRQAVGVGAGQMSRVDAAKIALQRAVEHGHSLDGSVAASDAFLPFADTLEVLAEGGVTALVQPGGSVKDDVVIEAAKSLGVVMAFTGERHFRH